MPNKIILCMKIEIKNYCEDLCQFILFQNCNVGRYT